MNDETKFTDGPWDSRLWDGDEWPEKRTSIVDSEGRTLFINARYADNVDANAALIAAAPDLYKALKELMLAVTMEGMDGCFLSSMEDAEAAIKKARGE